MDSATMNISLHEDDLDDDELFDAIEEIEQQQQSTDTNLENVTLPPLQQQQQYGTPQQRITPAPRVNPEILPATPQKTFQDASISTSHTSTNSVATNTPFISCFDSSTSMIDDLPTLVSIATNTDGVPLQQQNQPPSTSAAVAIQTEDGFSHVKTPFTPLTGESVQQKNEAYVYNKFGLRSFQRGHLYFRGEHVFDVEEELQYEDEDNDCTILCLKSKCWGTAIEHYTQDLVIQMDSRGLIEVTASCCTCPVQRACKHCVACLLQYLELKRENPHTFVVAPKTLGQEYADLLKRLSISNPKTSKRQEIQTRAFGTELFGNKESDTAIPEIDANTEKKDDQPTIDNMPSQSVEKTPERKQLSDVLILCLSTPSKSMSDGQIHEEQTKLLTPSPAKVRTPESSKIRLTQEDFNFGDSKLLSEEDDKENDTMSDVDDIPPKQALTSDDESDNRPRKRKFIFEGNEDLPTRRKRQRVL